MITVKEAEQLIHRYSLNLKTRQVPLMQATGMVVGEDIRADRDFPPFDRVTMDGIAINYRGWEQGVRDFKIIGVQAAGVPPMEITSDDHCLEIMTGAVLPQNADAVIPYEEIEITNGQPPIARVQAQKPKKGQNIHRRGHDRQRGATIVPQGTLLAAPEIGVAATVGKTKLLVIEPPKVAIVSTGDELVSIEQDPLPHQIRSSNAATMANALGRWNIGADLFHLVDDLQGTKLKLKELIENYPILILSGGVSKGKFDHVPQALELLKVQKCFHRIRQRPGKPFWFGAHENGTLIFAFPGNPVSSFMCFSRYLRPWLDRELAGGHPQLMAVLRSDVHFEPDLTYFAQVRIQNEEGTLAAWPVEGHGSGDLANLVDADGFLELPRGQHIFKSGGVFPLYPYRDL